MIMLIYIDTNIYLDLVWGRKDYLRDLGDFAFLFLKRGLDCEFKIIVSDWVLTELSKHIDNKKVEILFKDFKEKDKIITISKTKDDCKKARSLSPEHPDDALHAVLAKKAGAECVVTRNLSHYAGTESLIDAKLPENA